MTGAKKSAMLRASPPPSFVDAEWVKVQFGSCAPKKQMQIASRLAEKYEHWTGDEADAAFCRKAAEDLAAPGFLDEIFDAHRGEGGKKPGKPPFHFMLRRIFSNLNKPSKPPKIKDADICKSALRAALREKREVDARDFAFFAAIWLDIPGEVAEMVADSPAEEPLRDFLRDFAKKSAEKEKVMREDALKSARAEWKKLLSECAAVMRRRAEDEPGAEAAKPGADAKAALRAMAGKLSPFAEEEDVAVLHQYLMRLADGERAAPDSFDIKKWTGEIDGIAKLLARRADLLSDMRREPKNVGAIEQCMQKIKTVQKEITAAVARLLPQARGEKSGENKTPAAPPIPKIPKKVPPPPATPPAKAAPAAPEISPPPPAVSPAPPVLTEDVPPPVAPEESEADAEERKYAERINALVQKLILAEMFDAAYHIAKCGEKKAPDKMAFPAAALRLLAFPESSGEGVAGLEECLRGDGGETRKIAAFAAALFPAVFHLSSGAREMYRDYGPLSDCGEARGLDELRIAAHSFENWTLNGADFNASAGEDAPRDSAADRKRELAQWYDANKAKTLKFAPATHAWGKWMKAGGLLGQVICPLLESDSAQARADAEEFLHDHQGDAGADAEIGKIPGKKIEGNAKIHLRALFGEGMSLMQKAVDAMRGEEKKPQMVGALDAKCLAFRRALDNLDLAELPGDAEDSARAARGCLRRAAGFFAREEMERILSGARPARAPGLARVAGARHDCAGYPFKYSGRIVELTEEAMRRGSFSEDPADACRRQIAANAMLSAQLLLAESDETDAERLRPSMEKRIESLRSDLTGRIAALKKKLNGVPMPHGAKERIREQLTRVEPDGLPMNVRREGEVVVDFPQAMDIIDRAEREANGACEDKLRSLRARIGKAKMSEARKKMAREALENEDAILAEYLADWDDSEETLERIRRRSSPQLRRFLDGGYVAKAAASRLEPAFAAEAEARAASAEIRERGKNLLRKWTAMFDGRDGEESRCRAVQEWLGEIGFAKTEARAAHEGGHVASVFLKTDPYLSSPVAAFGSRADGEYCITVAAGGTTIDEMRDAANAAQNGGAHFVLFDGVLQENEREEFRRKNEEAGETIAPFDRASLLYLCLPPKPENPREMFFDLSLPFAGANPFAGGGVPPEMFYGRKEEINAVAAADGGFLVCGGKAAGKTALLHQVWRERHRPGRKQYAVVADLRADENRARLQKSLSSVWDILWEKASAEAAAESGARAADEKLREWLDADPERSLLAMLDEADDFLEKEIAAGSPNLVRCRNLMDKYGGRFKCVFAGGHIVRRSARRANAALARYEDPICIGPLAGAEQAAAARLIAEPFAAAGFVFADDSLPLEAANRANFYPSLIQCLCRRWLEELRAVPGGLRTIDADHLKAAFSRPNLRKHLGEIFDDTLNLDKRYALIAHVVALAMMQAREDSRVMQGEAEEDIRRACAEWRKESARNLTAAEFQILLEEMADLGVLRRDENSRKWLLRSDLALSLAGGREEVEEKLLSLTGEDFRSPLNLSDSHRRELRGGFSPLTLHQEDRLLSHAGGRRCFAMIGGSAAGIESAPEALRRLAEERGWLYGGGQGEGGIDKFKRELAAFEKRIHGGKKAGGIWCAENASPPREWMQAAREDSSFSKYPTAVVFLGDGGLLRDLPEEISPMHLGAAAAALLDGALRHKFNRDEAAEIKEVSGGFIRPINDLLATDSPAESLPKWKDDLAARGDSPEFWGLPAEWGGAFFELASLVADDKGEFSESDMEYGMKEIGGGKFAGWTPSAVVDLLFGLSLSVPAGKGEAGGGCRLIAPLHRAVLRAGGNAGQ